MAPWSNVHQSCLGDPSPPLGRVDLSKCPLSVCAWLGVGADTAEGCGTVSVGQEVSVQRAELGLPTVEGGSTQQWLTCPHSAVLSACQEPL